MQPHRFPSLWDVAQTFFVSRTERNLLDSEAYIYSECSRHSNDTASVSNPLSVPSSSGSTYRRNRRVSMIVQLPGTLKRDYNYNNRNNRMVALQAMSVIVQESLICDRNVQIS